MKTYIKYLLFTVVVNAYANDDMCRSLSLNGGDNFTLANAIENTYFYGDSSLLTYKDCPKIDDKCINRFMKNNKIKNNTKLLVGRKFNEFICASNINSDSAGWVKIKSLKFPKEVIFTPNSLIGKWIYDENYIAIEKENNNLRITGYAIWHGGQDNAGEEIIHDGEIDFSAPTPKNSSFKINNDSNCEIKLNLVNNQYLIVKDNNSCGGMNVTFNGVYSKDFTAK